MQISPPGRPKIPRRKRIPEKVEPGGPKCPEKMGKLGENCPEKMLIRRAEGRIIPSGNGGGAR